MCAGGAGGGGGGAAAARAAASSKQMRGCQGAAQRAHAHRLILFSSVALLPHLPSAVSFSPTAPSHAQGLTVLEYLLRHGSDACVGMAKGGATAQRLEWLSSGFHYVGPDGRDLGVNVRHRWAAGQGQQQG